MSPIDAYARSLADAVRCQIDGEDAERADTAQRRLVYFSRLVLAPGSARRPAATCVVPPQSARAREVQS